MASHSYSNNLGQYFQYRSNFFERYAYKPRHIKMKKLSDSFKLAMGSSAVAIMSIITYFIQR